MPEIGTKVLSNDALEALINSTFSDKGKTIAILEKWFCREGETPDFFGYLSDLSSKASEYDRGRVFNENCEIRWEREDKSYHVVWITDSKSIPDDGWEKEEIRQQCERKILLWGKRSQGQSRWDENQVPRIFEYPVEKEGKRVYAILKEYTLKDGSIVYRFKGVKAE